MKGSGAFTVILFHSQKLTLIPERKRVRVSVVAREECKKKKSIQRALNALFLFVTAGGETSNFLWESLEDVLGNERILIS